MAGAPHQHSSDDISFWFEDNERATMRLPETNAEATTSDHVVDFEDYDPTTDPFIWEILNSSPDNAPHGNLDAAGPSHRGGESSGHGGRTENTNVPQSSFVNQVQVSVWPVPPSPYTCSCCHTLREIIHTNGSQFAKLEIHGRIGLLSHAVLDKYDNVPSPQHEYKMFDFCKESMINVKKFMLQYCEDCQREGYSMLKDPLALFYDVLIVGLDFDNLHQTATDINPDDFLVNTDDESSPVQQTNEVPTHSKSSLAMQRERTGKMTLADIEGYFHLPIEEAAKEMSICPTVMKKICRRNGLLRWPYRKIKSITKKISDMRESLINITDVRERARVEAEIQRLEQEVRGISSV